MGGTGVVGVLRNGDGPTALLRADMDGLPVLEGTGLPYASTARGTDPDGHDVPVTHACGHDMHVTCLLGALQELADGRGGLAGTVLAVFQPAEEIGQGAQAMIDDGLFDRFGRAGGGARPARRAAACRGAWPSAPEPAFAAADALRVMLHGRGGHGSRPEATVDPVVMAAATVMRLQTIASREIAGTDTAIVTVGALRAGTKENIIPDDAELLLSVRTLRPRGPSPHPRRHRPASCTREAAASGRAAAPGGHLDRRLPGRGQRS